MHPRRDRGTSKPVKGYSRRTGSRALRIAAAKSAGRQGGFPRDSARLGVEDDQPVAPSGVDAQESSSKPGRVLHWIRLHWPKAVTTGIVAGVLGVTFWSL